ncbi:hypothetical protein [Halarsenatibacter silvermanii]|uniref:Uncharacterized protein n=1 Tax=Halarsenatibacter silvermanii TaxID=321763 RepID=A0A1G9RDZ9_9FIRM|nr:hypothetical protein [Halarsenatibacter silvermanii]SDM20675.1 hypothetical protein SAMN04488692_12130 [Halarsenatibacter silvermanii]
MREHGFEFKFIHKNSEGEVLNDSGFLKNHMTDDGFEQMYDVYFRGAAAPASFEIGLAQNSLGQDSSIGDVMEVTGEGYSAEGVSRDAAGLPSLGLDDGDIQVETATVQFENTGESAWDSAVDGYLASDSELVCYRPLSATRTLQPGDTLDVTIRVKGLQP